MRVLFNSNFIAVGLHACIHAFIIGTALLLCLGWYTRRRTGVCICRLCLVHLKCINMTTQHSNGIWRAQFRRLPNISPPELPDFTLEDKQRDGVAAGYPLHLCHLVEYYWATALPDTLLCREYVDWFVSECPCFPYFPYGVCLMNHLNFSQKWGADVEVAVELSIQSEGSPPLLWTLNSFIEGYDAQTGTFFEPHGEDEAFSVIAAGTWSPSGPPEA